MALKTTTIKILDDMTARYPQLDCVRENIISVSETLVDCHRRDGLILVCGNGGSAADSAHIVGELMKGFMLRRELPEADVKKLEAVGCGDMAGVLQQGIRAISLTEHAALGTAVLNDNDPLVVFAQQVYGYGRPGDVLIGMSTSGNAQNVGNAMKAARAFGLRTIGFTGARESRMDEWCDVMVKVPETETYKVQELHLPVYHTICQMAEWEIFGGE